VRFFGDGPQNLGLVPEVCLGGSPEDPAPRRYAVIEAIPGRRGEVRLTLEGVATREAAEALCGRLVLADPAHLEPLAEGEHYCFELVGCGVWGSRGEHLGRVVELWDTGAHDVLVIEDEDGRRFLVPMAEELVREVDVGAGRIVLHVIPGLLDAYVRTE
jgi:16S rRNA processing protein RimM